MKLESFATSPHTGTNTNPEIVTRVRKDGIIQITISDPDNNIQTEIDLKFSVPEIIKLHTHVISQGEFALKAFHDKEFLAQ